jgi:TetR/AcrR family transcriptional regulator, lmrAB and yxaGH operons repressor
MSDRRAQIIEATCQLIETQGYHATGVNQILAESGAPKGSLYYYFPEGKEGLAVAAIEQMGRVIEQRIRQSLGHEADPALAVGNFLRQLAGFVEASGFEQGGPITAVALEAASTNERINAACRGAYQQWQTAVADKLIEAGIENGRAERLASLVIAAIEGAVILSRTRRTTQPLHDAAAELELLLGGVSSK